MAHLFDNQPVASLPASTTAVASPETSAVSFAVSKLSVQDAVRHDVIAGILKPGTRITEAWLAQRYGVSRVPVREALRALEAEGFVLSQVNVGSRVAPIPVDDADDLFAVREALEISTVRRAAKRAKALFSADAPSTQWWQARRDLVTILDDGDAAVESGQLDTLVDLNDRFHLGIATLGASPSLGVLLRQLSGKIEWLYAADEDSRGKRLWPDHRIILSAIDAGDDELAGSLMKQHVRESRIGYLSRHAIATSSDSEVTAAVARRSRA